MLERMTSVEYVTVLALSTNVDVLISQRETVTVMVTNLTLSVCGGIVLLTLIQTEYVMTRTTVLDCMTSVEYVMVLELSTSVDVQISEETVTVMVTSLTLRRLWWRLCC